MTTEFAPITARSPISTPPVTTQLTPNQTLSPILTGPRASKPCAGDRLVGVVVAMVGVADEAAVGEHHVVADLDPLDRREHRASVEKAAARRSGSRASGPSVSQQPGSSRVASPIVEPARVERLEHLALDRIADEEAAAGRVPVDSQAAAQAPVALVPAPLDPPGPPFARGRPYVAPSQTGSIRVGPTKEIRSRGAQGVSGHGRYSSMSERGPRGRIPPRGPSRPTPAAGGRARPSTRRRRPRAGRPLPSDRGPPKPSAARGWRSAAELDAHLPRPSGPSG